MENIKYSLFDLFVYLLPGTFFLFALVFVREYNPKELIKMVDPSFFQQNVNLFQLIVFTALSYITGFILCVLGNFSYKVARQVLKILFKQKKSLQLTTSSIIPISKKYVLVRERHKENKVAIEQWNVMKNLCSTLAFLFLVLAVIFYVRYAAFSWRSLIVGMLVSFSLFYKAAEYHGWVQKDLENAYQLTNEAINKRCDNNN